ncbi:MAG: GNAT family N-acetyltransferase, partial [Georgenia sp.]
MDIAEHDRLEQRLAVIKAVAASLDRRHEVSDLVYGSPDADEARRRVGLLLGVDAAAAEAGI